RSPARSASKGEVPLAGAAGWQFIGSGRLTLGELEALACALAAVFLAFLHTVVAGQEERIAQLLGHAADLVGTIGAFLLSARQTEHFLERAGSTLANRAGLSGDAAALNLGDQVEPAAHFGDFERPDDGFAVLLLGEVFFKAAAVDNNLARTFAEADAGHGGLAPSGAAVISLFGFRVGHDLSPAVGPASRAGL